MVLTELEIEGWTGAAVLAARSGGGAPGRARCWGRRRALPGFWTARGAPGVETRPLRYSGGALAQRSFAAAAAQGALLRSERGSCGG